MAAARGFTLIEAVAVIAFVGVALAGVTSLVSNNNSGLLLSLDVQRGAQLVQECAERAITLRRNLGFTASAIGNTMCDSLTALPSGYTRTVTVSSAYTGTASTACPVNATCKDVSITVAKGSSTSVSSLLLVNY